MTYNRHLPHLDLVTLLQSFSCLSSTARCHPMMPSHPYQFPRATTHATATSMRKSSWWGQWWWLNVWSLENPEVFLSSIFCCAVVIHNSIGRCVAASLQKWELVPWFQHGRASPQYPSSCPHNHMILRQAWFWSHRNMSTKKICGSSSAIPMLLDTTHVKKGSLLSPNLHVSTLQRWKQIEICCSWNGNLEKATDLKGVSSNSLQSLLGRRYCRMHRIIAIVPNCVKVNHSTLHPLGCLWFWGGIPDFYWKNPK